MATEKVVTFDVYVLNKENGIITAKVGKNLQSIFSINENDVKSGSTEIDPNNSTTIQCTASAFFTIETSNDSPRANNIEAYFHKFDDGKKRARVTFQTYLDEDAKLGTGGSPQPLEVGLKLEFIGH